MKPRKLVIMK